MLYANRDQNDANFNVTSDEMKRFIGILLFSGYHFVTSERDYWSNQPDLKVSFIADSMSRDRFLKIKKYFHVADNQNLEVGNRVAKVSFLYSSMNDNLCKWGIFHKKLSIDESMVPYYGKYSAKQYMKGKPIRFGYKIWALCGADGYPYKLTIYTGKNSSRPPNVPLGEHVVTDLLKIVIDKSDPKYHEIYFDNFFTSAKLLDVLSPKGFICVGTVRENRTNGATKAMISTKDLKKKDRGSYDYRCNNKIFVCKWHDNSVVNVASNYFTHEPVKKVSRYVSGKGKISVPQPHLLNLYNQGMGGIDLMDRLLGSYRPMIRAKKCWWPLMTNLLNISVVAAWRFYCALHPEDKKMTHLDFRREIVLVLMKSEEKRMRASGGTHCDLPQDVRYDGINHDPAPTQQGRCVVCQKNTRSQCAKCKIRLHYSKGSRCFKTYYTE